MSTGVLFDAPGPATRARHRVYTVVASVVLLAAAAFVIWRLYDSGQFEGEKWEPFVTPAYVRALLIDGLVTTIQMAVSAVALAVVFGLVFGTGKLSERAWVRGFCWLVVEFFRAVPVILLMIFCFYAIFADMDLQRRQYWSVVLALTLYNGAVLAEVFRAGINAVPKGQGEAAYAIGMRKSQVMNIVLLPQAVKIMIPAIISQMVVALKDTSLGYVIASQGLTRIGKSIYTQFGNHVPTIIVVASLYIIINLMLTWLATWVQRKFVGEKDVLQVAAVGEQTAQAVPFYKGGDTGGGPV